MRDKLLMFGTATAATKGTAAYCADVLDMGNLAEHRTGRVPDAYVCFKVTTAGGTGDTVLPILADCDTESGTYTILREGKVENSETLGDVFVIEVPASHRRFLKAGIVPSNSGALAKLPAVEAWIQLGQDDL